MTPLGSEGGSIRRRLSERQLSDREIFCEAVGEGILCPARIRDVSRHGIQIVIQHRFAVGALLQMHVKLAPGEGQRLDLPLARVMWLASDGDFVVGCAFQTPLTEEQFKALL